MAIKKETIDKEIEKVTTDAKDAQAAVNKVVKDVAEDAAKAVKKVAKDTEPAIKAVKETTKKAVKKAATDTKKAAKKTATDTKKAAKKVAGDVEKSILDKKATEATVYFEFNDKQLKARDILAKVEQEFIDAGNKAASIKNIQLYIKAEDNAAYYVINDNVTGKIDL